MKSIKKYGISTFPGLITGRYVGMICDDPKIGDFELQKNGGFTPHRTCGDGRQARSPFPGRSKPAISHHVPLDHETNTGTVVKL
jgi:hypothetical protein